jgi:hypothetical protein
MLITIKADMAFKQFKILKTEDDFDTKLQNNIAESLQPIIKNTRLDSLILKNIVLISGPVTKVPHKLGRVLSGWNVVRQRAQATVWDTQDSNLSPELYLYLKTSADVVVDIEVF